LKLQLGFSPCPNDTFIFDALVHHKIDTEGLGFDVVLEDVETLNRWAIENKLHITKLSFATWVRVEEQYRLLQSGAALGRGVGPLLIGANAFEGDMEAMRRAVAQHNIVLPGQHTTAHLLFRYAFPEAHQKSFQPFHEIEAAVLQPDASNLGVIIHENRFTYQQKGLHRWLDLGAYWEQQTGLPIPLGGIAIHTSLGEERAQQVSRLIKKSLEYAFANYPVLPPYVRDHAQEMDEAVMRQHIDLYVNDYSLQLDEEAYRAIGLMKTLK
jgi:1,4-dihydroxy-6-naphthoate synthase